MSVPKWVIRLRDEAQGAGIRPRFRGLRWAASCCRVQSAANEKEEISVLSMDYSVRIDVSTGLIEGTF